MDDVPAPTADDARIRRLWEAWCAAAQPSVSLRHLDGMAVPGTVALRSRFHLLTDPEFRPHPNESFEVPWLVWCEHLRLETEGDAALVLNDCALADRLFSELVDLEPGVHHRLVTVNALIGLGDAARQRDDHEVAIARYTDAVRAASEDRYRFGLLRALVPLAHLTLTVSSATEAEAMFGRAEAIARELDERLYVANALTGRGEVLSRMGRAADAAAALREAATISDMIGSDVGVGNANQRLGDVLYRSGDLDGAADALTIASAAYERAGAPVGAANTADSLADVLLRRGDPKRAVREYQRAFAFAEAGGYRRGQAHAYTGVARCASAVDEWALSESFHEKALAVYDDLGDLVGRTTSLAGLAACADARDDHSRSCDLHVAAVGSVEAMRAAHTRDDLQREYRQRFAVTYRQALLAAVAAGRPEAFVAVFEGLAGRRLVGLLERVADDAGEAGLLGQLLARADQRLAGRNPVAESDRRTRLIRMLGAAGLRAGLASPAREALEKSVSSLYQPFDPSLAPIVLRGSARGAHLLLLTIMPGVETGVARLWRRPDGEAGAEVLDLDQETVDLLRSLSRRGMHPDARRADVAALARLLPEGLDESLDGADDGLVIVPLGALWSVPWPAVPLPSGRMLGEVTRVAITPSLTMYERVAARPRRRPATPPLGLACWRSPNVDFHDLQGFDEATWHRRELAGAGAAREAVTSAIDDVVVLAGHGRSLDGTGHYLELAPGEPLTPADLLGANAPETLVLVACWGAATPITAPSEPLTLATMALAAGSRQVAATVAELGDNVRATRFLELVLERLADRSMSAAVHDATDLLLRDARIRNGPLRDWAPLVTIGTL